MADSLAKLGFSWKSSLQTLDKPPNGMLGTIQQDMECDINELLI